MTAKSSRLHVVFTVVTGEDGTAYLWYLQTFIVGGVPIFIRTRSRAMGFPTVEAARSAIERACHHWNFPLYIWKL